MAELMRLRAQGAQQVEQTWRDAVPSARLQQVDTHGVDFEWASARAGAMSAVSYRLSASVRSAIQPEGQLIACRVLSRSGHVGDDQGGLDLRQPWISSGRAVRTRWQDEARVQALIFDLDAAERSAREITGDDGLRLRTLSARPVSAAAGRHWQSTYRYVAATLLDDPDADTAANPDGAGDDDSPESPFADPLSILEAELARHALRTTLLAFTTTASPALERRVQRRAAPATVRRALAYIESHAADPITVDDVALAAGISTRGLQYAFRRALDTTPTEHLRRARLAGAHADLLSDRTASVAQIARRWGFAHPSRFAAYYRQEYGRTPGQTARDAR